MGTHEFPLRDIALQSGLSLATVDRVVNQRGGVRPNTVREVQRAIAELGRQASQVRLVGRRYAFDLVMQSPPRFQSVVQSAVDRAIAQVYPAQVRMRYRLDDHADVGRVVDELERVKRAGSHGVILKAPDDPRVRESIADLTAVGISVVTLVTDVLQSERLAYVGMDNSAAGATAAQLVALVLGEQPGAVLVNASSDLFRGEGERLSAFRKELRRLQSAREVIDLSNSDGLDESVAKLVNNLVKTRRNVLAVYSVGGGNRAIRASLDAVGIPLRVFIAHDLDDDNRELLADGGIDLVLHHDLDVDASLAIRLLMAHSDGAKSLPLVSPSPVQVVTRGNPTS